MDYRPISANMNPRSDGSGETEGDGGDQSSSVSVVRVTVLCSVFRLPSSVVCCTRPSSILGHFGHSPIRDRWAVCGCILKH